MIAYIMIAIWCFACINIDSSQFNMWLFHTRITIQHFCSSACNRSNSSGVPDQTLLRYG